MCDIDCEYLIGLMHIFDFVESTKYFILVLTKSNFDSHKHNFQFQFEVLIESKLNFEFEVKYENRFHFKCFERLERKLMLNKRKFMNNR